MSNFEEYFCWQQIPSPTISEILCLNSSGVVLDTEHGCYNNETIFSCIQIIKSLKKKCFVRLTEVSKTITRYCLDSGADGIIFSTIDNEEQCEKIIEYCCFPNKGKRGLGLVRQNLWGQKELLSEDPILIPQIETKKGVDNLQNIASFDFDYFLIGPYDLSLSLGVPSQFESKIYKEYLKKIEKVIPKEKMAVHIPNDVEKQLDKYSGYGMKCLGMDTIALLDYHKEISKNVRF